MKSRLSHIEINVLNYIDAIKFYDKILPSIGFTRTNCMNTWTAYSDGQSKFIICPTEERFKIDGFHRKRAGLNHLAFYAFSKEEVDHFYENVLSKNGISTLYEKGPHGDDDYYAVFFEGPDRLKLELVYAPKYCDLNSWPNTMEDELNP